VVRMIEHYLGAEAFRDGVRIYMQRHRERNTVARDLWRALEEASGRDVDRVAQAWIEKPGFPLVVIHRGPEGGLAIHQERFFSDPKIPAARRRAHWPVPLVVKHSGTGRDGEAVERFLIDRAAAAIDLGGRRFPHWVYGNAEAGGFYRVCY